MRKSQKSSIIRDHSLAYAVRKGDIPLNLVPKEKRKKIKGIVKGPIDTKSLEKSSKNKYKCSRRSIKHRSKNESKKELDFEFISNIKEWENRNPKLERELKKQKNKNIKMEKKLVTKFSKFDKINEDINPQRIPKENKFKGFIEFDDEYLTSLDEHGMTRQEGMDSGNFIVFDIMNKDYTFVDEPPTDIRPYNSQSFEHVMSNL